jgi:hypothetical protein
VKEKYKQNVLAYRFVQNMFVLILVQYVVSDCEL